MMMKPTGNLRNSVTPYGREGGIFVVTHLVIGCLFFLPWNVASYTFSYKGGDLGKSFQETPTFNTWSTLEFILLC